MNVRLSPAWKSILGAEFEQPYFEQLTSFVREEYTSQLIFPPARHIFRALDLCEPDRIRVVIIGQDPYHGKGQANGLCFSVNDGVRFPPSLLNIFKEVTADTGAAMPTSGNLDRWAEQGVLLLNAVLTVRAHQAASHAGHGWEQFTDAVVRGVASQREGVVYMLWGNYAQKKASMVDPSRNCILTSVHPSPLSAHRGFLGCRHFSQANRYLASRGEATIAW